MTESVNLWPQQPESLTVKCNYIIGSLSNTSPRHGILWGHCDKSFLWQKYDILYQILSRKKNRNFGGGKRLSSRCIANGKISRYSVKRFDSIAHALVVTLLNKSTELTFSSLREFWNRPRVLPSFDALEFLLDYLFSLVASLLWHLETPHKQEK